MESSSSSSSLSMVGRRNRCDVATTLYHYGTPPPQKQEYRNHHHPDPHHDSNDDDDDDDGCGSEHPSHAYDENDNYYVNHYNVIDRIDSTRISILLPPPPPPLLFQPQCGGTTCNGTNRRYHHSHTQRKKKKCSSSLYYFPPSLSLSPLVATKSMTTTYTPTTTASTATWTSTHERNVSQTKRSPSLSPPTRRLEPLLEHWNHHHHHPYDDDSSRHDSEPALQFVERTTCEMHEIVQYWLSRDLQQQLYGYDPADSLDVECTTNTSTTATTSILQQQQQQPLESLPPSPNNTLWNLSTDDMSYQQTNSCSDAHEEEDFAPQSHYHTNESLSLLSFEPSLVNGSSTVVHDTNVTQDADYDFDGCVEELFTELDFGRRRRMSPQRSHCHHHHHDYYYYHHDPTVTSTTRPTKKDDNTMDDDKLHYHHDSIVDTYDADDTQQELHHLATLLYSSDAVVIRDNYSRPSDAVLDIVHEASTTLLSRRRPRQIPFPLNCFMQRRQYHPYMMVHPKQKATSVLSTVAPTSLWQWIDEQMNQGDLLQRQQFQRRVSNVVFILVSLLMSLLFILLLLQSIQFLYSHGWYLPFAPNNQAIEHAWAGNMIHTSTLSCHVT